MPESKESSRRDDGLLLAAGSRRGSSHTKRYRQRYRNKGGTVAYIYCITDGTYFKIGWAVDPTKRLRLLQTGSPIQLRIHAAIRCKNTAQAMQRERNLHKKHRKHRVLGEWFTDAVANKPFGKYKEVAREALDNP